VRCQEQESCSILVERTRESKREVELRKETAFAEGENIPKQREVRISDSKEEQAVPYGFVEVIQHVMCTEIEEDSSCNF
jgi:glutaredoxin